MFKQGVIIISLLSSLVLLNAQDVPENFHLLPAEIEDGDTTYLAHIDEVHIFPGNRFRSNWEARRYRRLIQNLKIVYPYAKLAGDMFKEMNEHYLTLDSEKERKEYAKQVEDRVRSEFEDDLKQLTITQGRLLIKLIDRETGETSYAVVKEFRGTFSAFFWQALARLFGSNLKSEYDPHGEDRLIEDIITRIERGYL
ncbi:MAG: DUF4294 domain-containing protein [Bacteroidota bacterium]